MSATDTSQGAPTADQIRVNIAQRHDEITKERGALLRQIGELDREDAMLERMAEVWDLGSGEQESIGSKGGKKPPATEKPSRNRAPAARKNNGKRGRPVGSGNRAAQALEKIGEQQGITAAELAESLGMSRNYLYRVLPRLQREGKIEKRGTRGYYLAPDAE